VSTVGVAVSVGVVLSVGVVSSVGVVVVDDEAVSVVSSSYSSSPINAQEESSRFGCLQVYWAEMVKGLRV